MSVKTIEVIIGVVLLTTSLITHSAVATQKDIDKKLSAMQLSNWTFFMTLLYFCMR